MVSVLPWRSSRTLLDIHGSGELVAWEQSPHVGPQGVSLLRPLRVRDVARKHGETVTLWGGSWFVSDSSPLKSGHEVPLIPKVFAVQEF